MFSVFLLMALSIALGGSNSDTETFFFGYKPTIVTSGSMEPAIRVNSISMLKQCTIDDIEIGDVVMYRSIHGYNVTHRVVDKTSIGLITKGDNNADVDGYYITADLVRAKVVWTCNWVAPIITVAFGDFTELILTNDYRGFLFGFMLMAIILSLCYFIINWVYSYTVESILLLIDVKRNGKNGIVGLVTELSNDRVTPTEYETLLCFDTSQRGIFCKIRMTYYKTKLYNRVSQEQKLAKKSKRMYERTVRYMRKLKLKEVKERGRSSDTEFSRSRSIGGSPGGRWSDRHTR